MPSEILKSKKLKIRFDQKLFIKKTLIFFLKIKCDLKIDNLIDQIWKRKIYKKLSKFYKFQILWDLITKRR